MLTDSHPDSKATPGCQIQLHHEINVDKDTEERQPGQERDLQDKQKDSD